MRHAAGQMHLNCNYAAEHWTSPGENPPVDVIQCAQRDCAVANYALDGFLSRMCEGKDGGGPR